MFRDEGKYFQRINIATPEELLKDALFRLEKVFGGI